MLEDIHLLIRRSIWFLHMGSIAHFSTFNYIALAYTYHERSTVRKGAISYLHVSPTSILRILYVRTLETIGPCSRHASATCNWGLWNYLTLCWKCPPINDSTAACECKSNRRIFWTLICVSKIHFWGTNYESFSETFVSVWYETLFLNRA